ncbi:hypothetical protein, partial [Acetobacter tropicalis]|uniref:hypothetical protein n=1 Tax=Acetobacter tropicalis TaxID=104102 RepID=UPI001F328371
MTQTLLTGGITILIGSIVCQKCFQYHAKPVFREQTGGEMLHDQRIEQIHADAPPLAGRLSLPGLCRAGII